MVHTQDPTAWCIFVPAYAYICFAVWFLKHHSTQADAATSPDPYVYGPYYMDKALKVAFGALWLIMAFMNIDYTWRLDGHTNPIVRVQYFLFMQLFTTLFVLAYGLMKNLYPSALASAAKTAKVGVDKSYKSSACLLAVVWISAYSIWQMCWFTNSFFNGLAAMDNAAKIGVTASVLITASFGYSLAISQAGAVNFVDTTDDATGSEEQDRPVIGTTPGLLVEVVNDWAFIVVFNMLSIYMWTVIFNNYGQIFLAVLIQQFATMYCTHWSGTWNAWFEFFQFFTMILCQLYSFVPGTFFRYGFTNDAIPDGEYKHLMFFMDQSNADMGFPAGVMAVNQMAITGVSLAIGAFCFVFTVKHFRDNRTANISNTKNYDRIKDTKVVQAVGKLGKGVTGAAKAAEGAVNKWTGWVG